MTWNCFVGNINWIDSKILFHLFESENQFAYFELKNIGIQTRDISDKLKNNWLIYLETLSDAAR